MCVGGLIVDDIVKFYIIWIVRNSDIYINNDIYACHCWTFFKNGHNEHSLKIHVILKM